VKTRDEILHALLEEMESRGESAAECVERHGREAASLEPMLVVAERLRSAPAVSPSPAFRSAARTRMLNLIRAADVAPPPRARSLADWPRRLWQTAGISLAARAVATALIVAILVIGGGFSLVALAAPDSPLYPAKLAMEDARASLAAGDAERAGLYLEMVERRTSELEKLVDGGEPAALEQVVNGLEQATQAAVEAAEDAGEKAAMEVDARLAFQQERLREMERTAAGTAPEVRDRLAIASAYLERGRAGLRALMGGGPGDEPSPQHSGDRYQHQQPSGGARPGSVQLPLPPGATSTAEQLQAGEQTRQQAESEPARGSAYSEPPPASPGETAGTAVPTGARSGQAESTAAPSATAVEGEPDVEPTATPSARSEPPGPHSTSAPGPGQPMGDGSSGPRHGAGSQ
jgi:hypothetical protein